MSTTVPTWAEKGWEEGDVIVRDGSPGDKRTILHIGDDYIVVGAGLHRHLWTHVICGWQKVEPPPVYTVVTFGPHERESHVIEDGRRMLVVEWLDRTPKGMTEAESLDFLRIVTNYAADRLTERAKA